MNLKDLVNKITFSFQFFSYNIKKSKLMNTDKLLDFTDVVNYLDAYDNSLLLNAVAKNDKEMVKKLISLGANMNQFNSYRECALTKAHQLKDKYLIDNFFPQYHAQLSEESKSALLKKLDKEELEKYKALYPINDNNLALFTNLEKGFLEEVKNLLDNGVSPNIKNKKGTPLLATMRSWSATQKLNVLKLCVGKSIDFSLQDEYKQSVLSNLVSSYRKSASDKKIIPFIIKHFNIENFTISPDYQGSFLLHLSSKEDFQKYFLNHITEKNYQKIYPSLLIHYSKLDFLDEFMNKIEKNNWNINFKVEDKPFIYHFIGYEHDFHNKVGTFATKLSTQLDLNFHYEKSEPLSFALLLNSHHFDLSKVDIEKMNTNGDKMLSLFTANIKNGTLLTEYNLEYSKPYFNAILNNPKSDIYHENLQGESFISRLVKFVIEEKLDTYVFLREEDKKKFKLILKEVFKVKPYQSSYKIKIEGKEKSLEQCLKSIFSAKQVLQFEKENLEKMIATPNKTGQKIKI
jgi:ankyrin repeat protein